MIIILKILGAFIIGFAVGWWFRKRKFSKETAVQVIDNLKATNKIYQITYKENKAFLTQKNTDLKIDILKCYEENKLLKEEVKNLKK